MALFAKAVLHAEDGRILLAQPLAHGIQKKLCIVELPIELTIVKLVRQVNSLRAALAGCRTWDRKVVLLLTAICLKWPRGMQVSPSRCLEDTMMLQESQRA